ncbi:hypothetical protein MTO96_027471 [Rhipicephalus appendiculatus]
MISASSPFSLSLRLAARPPLHQCPISEISAPTFETVINCVGLGLETWSPYIPWKLSLQMALAAGRRTLRAVTVEAFVAGVGPRSNGPAESLDRFQGRGSRWGFVPVCRWS